MIVKVCGLKYRDNIDTISSLNIQMVGFNFYRPSSRYIEDPSLATAVPQSILKVGVFVNASQEDIHRNVDDYQLDLVQLHGDEDADFGTQVAKYVPVIKVARIKSIKDFDTLDHHNYAHSFLFDTYTKNYGGSGNKFQWEWLVAYQLDKPFLVSGGIGPNDVDQLRPLSSYSNFLGIDINSKFETKPGYKDPEVIAAFLKELNEN